MIIHICSLEILGKTTTGKINTYEMPEKRTPKMYLTRTLKRYLGS